MGQFLVIDPNAVGELMTDQVGLTVWPQPYADGPLRLQAEGLEGRCTVALADALGRTVLLEQTVFSDGRGSMVLPVVGPGHYVLRITARGHVPLATTLIVQP